MPPQDQPPLPPNQSFPEQTAQHPAAYDFIINPAAPQKPFLAGADSTVKRIGIVLGGLLVMIIIGVIIKNMLVGKPKVDSMLTVAQAQQELIHLSSNANQQQGLSDTNKNLVATIQLSLSSAQSQIVTYLGNNHFKVNSKTLSLGVHSDLDQQLTNAATAGTYNQTLQEVIKTQLNNYSGDLQQALTQISGPKGHALLKSDYDQAQLLQNQLNSSAVGS